MQGVQGPVEYNKVLKTLLSSNWDIFSLHKTHYTNASYGRNHASITLTYVGLTLIQAQNNIRMIFNYIMHNKST